ncbi:hypothetical protein Salpa_4014 [Sporomusa sp. KB1]|jgi:hypothetical protein|nr:hypothetical protein Salpa_4014 [Sporomusa sp. KB1]
MGGVLRKEGQFNLARPWEDITTVPRLVKNHSQFYFTIKLEVIVFLSTV